MFSNITSSPTLVRVVPFAIFIVLTHFQNHSGESGRYWYYLAKTVVGAGIFFVVWKHIQELEWKFSWEALVVGVGVFAMWVGIDSLHLPNFLHVRSSEPAWNPNKAFGEGSALAWFFIVVRTAGSTLVVPPLEEGFYRSFLYRYLWNKDFLKIPLNKFIPISFLITSVIFASMHQERLAALLCGFAYHGLVLRKNRLGDAMTAHAITNFLLAIWIVWKGAWQFW